MTPSFSLPLTLALAALAIALVSAHFEHDGSHLSFHPVCAPTGGKCESTSDCCLANVCTPTPWAPELENQCLPKVPKCHAPGNRCAGEPGHEYVPYALCCGKYECVKDAGMGWGKWCKASKAKKVA